MYPSQLNLTFAKPLMAGGSALLALTLLLDLNGLSLAALGGKKASGEACQTVVQADVKISRQQLAKLLTLVEGSKKQQVRDILKQPYCQLASLQVRTGALSQRDVYPLDFESQTRLVVLYEGEEYAGYRFDLQP
jgi:hypothetical protein